MKKIIVVSLFSVGVFIMGIISVSALSNCNINQNEKAEIISSLTGKTVEEINQERVSANTYGEVAQNNGVLEEFRQENNRGINHCHPYCNGTQNRCHHNGNGMKNRARNATN